VAGQRRVQRLGTARHCNGSHELSDATTARYIHVLSCASPEASKFKVVGMEEIAHRETCLGPAASALALELLPSLLASLVSNSVGE